MNIRNFMGENKVHANKFHNFMVYEAIQQILLTKELESKISSLIENAHLTKGKNPFFIKAKQIPYISLESALNIAFNWREIMKQFMITVLMSMGELADKVNQLDFSPEYAISALKIGITVVSDGLNKVFSEREKEASKDPDGVNYIWWETSILSPLIAATKNKSFSSEMTISPKAHKLLKEMNKLAKHPLGFAVQLYVIEAISLDIILAFLPLFSRVEVNEQKIFKSSEIISWMMAHLQDELIHIQQPTHDDNGMVNTMSTAKDQEDLFLLAHDYIQCWGEVLEELGELLSREPLDYGNKMGLALKTKHCNNFTLKCPLF